jgi:surfactin synthase thioesterase subunit
MTQPSHSAPHPDKAATGRVLLIHGGGGGGWEWAIWRRVLEAHGYTVHAPDLQPAAAGLGATGLADYLAQLLALDEPWDAVAGASLGGRLALELAARLAIPRLLLINPLLKAEPNPARPTVIAWADLPQRASTRRALPDADPGALAWAHARWRDESARVIDEAGSWPIPTLPVSTRVQLLLSREDRDVPPDAAADWAARHRHDVRWTGASHAGPLLGRDAARFAEDWGRSLGPLTVSPD